MKMPLIKTLKLLALKSIIKPEEDYFLRKVFRWYSIKFSTPLHIVSELPLDEVLMHYFETKYEDLKDSDDQSEWLHEMTLVTETEQERYIREMNEESNEASDQEFLEQVMREEQTKRGNVENIKPIDRAPIPTNRDRNEVELPKPQMSEIKMEFVSEAELAKLAEFDVLGDLSPKKG